jgi:hypothetical protein
MKGKTCDHESYNSKKEENLNDPFLLYHLRFPVLLCAGVNNLVPLKQPVQTEGVWVINLKNHLKSRKTDPLL